LVCFVSWLRIIPWVLVTTIGCSWVILTIFSIVSSCSVLIAIGCNIWVVLRQLHGLLLHVSVHPAFLLVAVVVVIIIFDHHELGPVLRLFGLLLFGHFRRMMDRMR
jgi:glycerol-3-phosphate acyltransferase PlsY